MLARFDGGDRLLRMQELGRGNHDSVDLGVFEQQAVVGGPRRYQQLSDVFGDRGADIAYLSYAHQSRQALQRRHVRARGNATAADKSDIQLRHAMPLSGSPY